MNDLIYKTIFVLLLLKLLMTMYQRKYNEEGTFKRVVSLYQSMGLGLIYILMSIIKAKGFNENLIVLVLVGGIIMFFLLRKTIFPYSSKCVNCNKRLKLSQILFIDSLNCTECEEIH